MFKPRNAPARSVSAPAPHAAVTPSPVPSDDGWFRGFGGTKAAGEQGVFFQPGTYIVDVLKMERAIGQNPKKNKGQQLFIARFKVVEVEAAFPADPTPPSGWGASNRVGEEISKIENCGFPQAPNERAYANIKQLLLAIARCDSPDLIESDYSDDEWTQNLQAATDPPGTMCAGYRLRVVCSKKIVGVSAQNPTGTNFTPTTFHPVAPPPAP